MAVYSYNFMHEKVEDEYKSHSKPLDKDQKAIAKNIKDAIKKYAPSIISSMNKDENAMKALNNAISHSNKKDLKAKYAYSVKSENDNTLAIYCVDKSIVNAIGDDDKMPICKYTRKVMNSIADKIYDKMTDMDFGKLSLSDEVDDIDGCIEFEIIA